MNTRTNTGEAVQKVRCVIIDNYDSFTYNLVHLVRELGAEVTVFRNDAFELPQLEAFDNIILSPGPGIPSQAGQLLDIVRQYTGRKPILGVCLGHQAIAEVFGGRLENLPSVYHGVTTKGHVVAADPIFRGLSDPITMGRYHSWTVSPNHFPDELEVTAVSEEGCIMALRHRHYNIHGIQFHPESVLTPKGAEMIGNWLMGSADSDSKCKCRSSYCVKQ